MTDSLDRAEAVWTAAPEPETPLADDSGLDPRLARLLARRGISSAEEVHRYLEPKLEHLHDPFLLAGMTAAVNRLLEARKQEEAVSIVGDYDVDGVSATAMLSAVFRACGLEALPILPNRMVEGYGFQTVHVERAAEAGAKVIVTADCGTRSVEAAAAALARGIDVIVTDHHIPGPALDSRVVQINPHQEGCQYPYQELSGAGLAFKLATALATAAGREIDPRALLRVACLGTIADLVPLTGENRTIAALGLAALDTTRSAGIKALIRASGVRDRLTAADIGYRLGPRLNAAGRMDQPEPALELLLERDPVRAATLAERLDRWNEERQAAERAVVEDARERFVENPPRFLMAWSPDWHRGVLGIAAGRLAREFHRPAVLLATDGSLAVGSGRSVRGVNLHDFLIRFEDDFERFGGHAQAIGMSVASERLEAIYDRLQEAAEEWDSDVFVPKYQYEAELTAGDVTLELVRELARLEPFGMANRRPLFRVGPLEPMVPPRHFGKNHLAIRGRGLTGDTVELVAWRWGDRAELFEQPFEVLGSLGVDSYLGRASVEVLDARSL